MLWWMGTKVVGFILLLIASFVYNPEVVKEDEVEVRNEKTEKSAMDNPVFSILDENSYNTKL